MQFHAQAILCTLGVRSADQFFKSMFFYIIKKQLFCFQNRLFKVNIAKFLNFWDPAKFTDCYFEKSQVDVLYVDLQICTP